MTFTVYHTQNGIASIIGIGNFGAEDIMLIQWGKNTQKIKEYIAHQLEEDRMTNQMTMDDIDPFNG